MGAWGTAISSNDTYSDVYADFFALYNNGETVDEISSKLISKYNETISDEDDANNFWFALAKCQWECQQLAPDIMDKVSDIVTTGADAEVWKNTGATNAEVKKRQIILEKFLNDLKTERVKPKPRKKETIQQPVFSKGDCLTFKLYNGNYGGAVVLESIYDTPYGYSLIAITRINNESKPTRNEYENAEVLTKNNAFQKEVPNVMWFFPKNFKKIKNLVELVANIDVQKKYDINKMGYSFTGINNLIEGVNKQLELEQTKAPSKNRVFIKEFIMENKWKLWQ